jgi:protoporphyrinogen oxidase
VKIGILGGGVAGMAAAYDLAEAGHAVVIYEAADRVGGLASGFRDAHWDWPLERFYHHLFETDSAIRTLVDDIGYGDKLFFRSPVTAQWWNGQLYPFDSPLAMLRFPGVPFLDRVRFGVCGAYLKYLTNDWRALERITAREWIPRWMGPRVYQTIWKPLLEGKFGPYVDDVNMAWLWARLKARSFQLGYFVGGFQGFADALLAALHRLGVQVQLQTPVQRMEQDAAGGWTIQTEHGAQQHERVIATVSPGLLTRLVPQLPSDYLGQLAHLKSMGAVVLVLALRQQLTDGFYWMQGMQKDQCPFLALVEHTNFIEPEHYGGDHLIYCGDYLPPEHEYFQLSHEELLERFLPALRLFNPAFQRDWVRASWLHRAPDAQPVVGRNHSQHIPPLKTPLRNLYCASMSQVYPWDRGTNFAVELGQRAATAVLTAGIEPA